MKVKVKGEKGPPAFALTGWREGVGRLDKRQCHCASVGRRRKTKGAGIFQRVYGFQRCFVAAELPSLAEFLEMKLAPFVDES